MFYYIDVFRVVNGNGEDEKLETHGPYNSFCRASLIEADIEFSLDLNKCYCRIEKR